MRQFFVSFLALSFALQATGAQSDTDTAALRARLAQRLGEIHAAAHFPGSTVGVALPDGTSFGIAVGLSDRERKLAMRPEDRLLAGSVGKTFVSAVAMQLVHEGKLGLDERIETYLGEEAWFDRLPNAGDITVRMLMRHTSGLVRYELNERFLADLSRDPDRVWKPEEEIAYLFGSKAPFAAGEGWDYSDTNYIVLGLIIERVTGAKLFDEIARRVLKPLDLSDVVPAVSRTVPGLVQGYGGARNPFGHVDAMIDASGKFAINPQFEWAGGGFATTARDLARWAKALYEARAFDAALMPQFLDGVDAKMLGPGVRYGLGVILRSTPLGMTHGHSGFFPGYQAEMRYYVDRKFAIAMQVNTSDGSALGRPLGAMLQDLAQVVADSLGE